ncbi:MAG: UDP-2,3-diacylglucosamine diphosphatase LpxI [Pirellulales bacterium]|nr:UDP-2,3-diacylglucosamine diphosphatase LpxI [Pirellulales bacterium]
MNRPLDKSTGIDAAHGPRLPRRVGLLAGWGRYPFVIAEHLRHQGIEVYCLGVTGHAEPGLDAVCDDYGWIGLCKIGRAIRYFRRHGITDVAMVGKIHKVALFQPWRWLKYLPDWTAIRIFAPHFLTRREDCRDDTLLGALVDGFASRGIHFGPATDYAPGLLADEEVLTNRTPSAAQWRDIEFGWLVAKKMGQLDIGQSVAIKDQAVMAVEAVEGTDECIRRAGSLCRAGGFTVVKVAKPQQDMRYDVPTVGLKTLETMIASGGRVLAIEAHQTILLEKPEVLELANRNKLTIVSLVGPENRPDRVNDNMESSVLSASAPLVPAAKDPRPNSSNARR